MASRAPGNGWFPYRAHAAPQARNDNAVRRQALPAGRNVDEVRHSRIPLISPTAPGSGRAITSPLFDVLVMESLQAGRAAAWRFAWGVFAAVLALIIWVGLIAACAGVAVALGVPWTTLAAALTGIHVLFAILIILLWVRIGPPRLSSALTRKQTAASAAA